MIFKDFTLETKMTSPNRTMFYSNWLLKNKTKKKRRPSNRYLAACLHKED